ncbi:hypothetical protein L7F22_057803 [Adiantum nelumboides]|nr:hypothetical protein [Adiantum nelumboides]
MFSELCSLAKVECPRSSVEQFLELQKVLSHATVVANALANMEKMNEEETNVVNAEFHSVCAEKVKRANAWVSAALSTDLVCFTLMTKQTGYGGSKSVVKNEVCKDNNGQKYMLVLEKASGLQMEAVKESLSSSVVSVKRSPLLVSPSSPRMPQHQNGNDKGPASRGDGEVRITKAISRRASNGTAAKVSNGKSASKGGPVPTIQSFRLPSSWIKGVGLQGIAELAMQLQSESRSWFLQFFEGALDNGFQVDLVADKNAAKLCAPQDNSQIAALLSQLKRVNDWLDQLDAADDDFNDGELSDTIVRLKQKIYDYLLQHVESAAFALGNQANS